MHGHGTPSRVSRPHADQISITPMLAFLGHEPTAMRREVLQALDFIDREHRRALNSTAIAEAAGLSERRLQELFREALGEPPMHVLRRVRLLRARELLLDSTEQRTIGQIAEEVHIPHLGRFAAYYAEAFQEPPSSTIVRVRNKSLRKVRARTLRYFNVLTMENRAHTGE
jgi:transcriptional regulator GlxA family with amidase domain